MIYSYGVLRYDFFTVAHDRAQLALEFAFRERFMEFHGGTVMFRDKDGSPHHLNAEQFDDLRDQISGHLSRRGGGWRLVLRRTGSTVYFDGMLDSLINWAHAGRGMALPRGGAVGGFGAGEVPG
jgi:hypothetical protein